MLRRVRHVSVGIERPPDEVYAFVYDPANLPRWATAFCRSVRRSGDEWIVETPEAPVRIAFVESNALGVLDHVVTVTSELEVFSPIRVVANGSGSEVLFTLFQRPGMSDAELSDDAALVQQDLETLKGVMERRL
jgi:hypothetical protein